VKGFEISFRKLVGHFSKIMPQPPQKEIHLLTHSQG
jgi:hypothetical protein